MIKEHFFFKSEKYQLFSALNYPQKNIKNIGIVLCHSFGAERTNSLRALIHCAEFLTKHGYHTFIFDYRGTGDSTGEFEIGTISGYLEDLNNAIKIFKLKTRIKTIGLFGFRIGASLIPLFKNEDNHDIKFLILYNPIINGKKYIKELLRINISYQMATYQKIIQNNDQLIENLLSDELVNLSGYYINGTFYNEMINLDLVKNKFIKSIKSLVIGVNNRAITNSFELSKFHNIINTTNNSKLITITELDVWKQLKIYYTAFQNLPNEIIKWLN